MPEDTTPADATHDRTEAATEADAPVAAADDPAPRDAPETRAVDAPAEARALDSTDLPDDDDAGDDAGGRGMKVCRAAVRHAKAMIAAGKVDHGPFTFDAADRAKMLGPRGTHASELARHHLGTDESEGDEAGRCAYPFAKDGMAYSRAFRSIARRAAAAGHDDVARAANDLMELAKPPEDDGKDEPEKPRKKGRSGAAAHRRTLEFRVTRTSDDGSYFEGYAAVLHNVDEYGTIMARGCFDRDLDRFRDEGFLGGLNHDWDNPVGSPSTVRLDAKGLFVGGGVIDTAHGLDLRKLLRAGIVKKMSFGFDVLESRWLEEPEDVEEYWRSVGYAPTDQDRDRARKGVMLFTRLRIYEASPVMVPGNQLADITAVREAPDAGAGGTPRVTLETHALAVHDAAGALCDRFEQVARLRAGDGRSLGRDKLAQLARIRDRLDAALAACQPRAPKADVAALRRELLTLSARAHRPA